MSHCKSAFMQKLSVSLLTVLLVISICAPVVFGQGGGPVLKRVRCVIEIQGLYPVEFTNISGPCDMIWSDPYPDGDDLITIDIEIVAMDLLDGNIAIRRNPGPVSPGTVKGISPGIDFPAESFFDVMIEVELPDHLPGELLINYEPMHLTSPVPIEQFPPYFCMYDYIGPPILLYSQDGIEMASILEWHEEILPYYPPEAFITCPTAYRSDVALINEQGLIEFPASLNGIDDEDIDFAEFSMRPFGDPGPFSVFYTDFSGAGTDASTINPIGEGDGWCGYFEPGSEPFEGQVAECRVEFFSPQFGPFEDTVIVWIDPTPPIPSFSIWRDSIIVYDIDSFFDITFELGDELPAPGPAELQVFTLTVSFQRTLTAIDQLGLGTDYDSTSCGPTAAASCLKYFADNGYPGLDNPGGDEAKPEQSGEDIARELQGAMGTNENGTSSGGMVSGIGSYLEGHGQSGWSVSGHPVESDTDLAEMFREFEADSEDVLVLLQDTTTTGSGAGDTIGHWVTLGSREQTTYGVGDSTKQFIDFMDPWGGGSTTDNQYEVGEDANGNPTTEGYDLDGAGGDAVIAGYIKVSPPEGGSNGSSPRISSVPGAPVFDPDWIPVDAGTARGNGEIDTLRWDTHGFMPGLYLMEVITTNHQGHMCRDLRMVLLVGPTTDADPETPGVKTGLRGTYPNPFNPTTTIAYSIEKDGPVTLAVYDISGRRIRTLLNAKVTEAGTHTITWDGLDDNGRSVASGVYFCRFLGADTESSTKMILLR